MSLVDDVVAAVRAAQNQLDAALEQCGSAASSADEAHGIAAQVGSRTATEGFANIKEMVNTMRQQVQSAKETGDSVIASAEAVRSGGT